MSDSPFLINNTVERALSYTSTKATSNQAYSGTDIKAVLYLPLISKYTSLENNRPKISTLADLQTISISSTRSIAPVRVLGRSSPKAYTRGARTFAGSLVFATINKDAFQEIYTPAIAESFINATTSAVSDQLPPFSVVITASNESGGAAMHIVHGITLVNYGTTYSIDDLYTETTYSYVATDVVPLSENYINRRSEDGQTSYKTITSILEENLRKAYSKTSTISNDIRSRIDSNFLNNIRNL